MDKEEMEKLVKGVVAEARRQDKTLSEGEKPDKPDKPEVEGAETFNCPECDEKVNANQKYCPGCGIELEWSE